MKFYCDGHELDGNPTTLVVAGWTGRDAAAVQHHIDELGALGVAPPSAVPLYYRCSANLLCTDNTIEVLGADSSGEAEPLLLRLGETWYLGIGSDHTDRKLESVSVAASKQICAKPVARELWRFEQVIEHLDQIEITSRIVEDGQTVDYQRGTLASIRPLQELLEGSSLVESSADVAMLCGTFAAIGGVRAATRFDMCMHDPVLKRSITHHYTVAILPVVN